MSALEGALAFQRWGTVPNTWRTEVKDESSSSEEDEGDEEEEREEDTSSEGEEVLSGLHAVGRRGPVVFRKLYKSV